MTSVPNVSERRIEYVDIDELVPTDDNPKRHDVNGIGGLMEAVGYIDPVVIDERTGRIIGGHGRRDTLRTMRDAGKQPPEGVRAENGRWLVPVMRGWASTDETAAQAALIGLNRYVERGGWDDQELASMLSALDDPWPATAGFPDDDLAALLAATEIADEPSPLDDDSDETPVNGFAVWERDKLVETIFAHYREHGFPYRSIPRFRGMLEINALAALSTGDLTKTRLGYVTADTYHPHRYAAHVVGTITPLQAFADDRRLRLAIEMVLDTGKAFGDGTFLGVLSLIRNAQAASNFRPGFALMQYRRFAPPGATVLDTSTGYGGRLVGFLASNAAAYIGIDPNKLTHDGNIALTADLCPSSKHVELINLPAEDVDPDSLAGRADFAFTSPPYFVKERYADDDTQSWVRYPQIDAWRDGFLVPMLRLQHAALKPGAHNVVNIADVRINAEIVPLRDMTIEAARSIGFEIVGVDEYRLNHRWGANQADDVAVEPCINMRRPEGGH